MEDLLKNLDLTDVHLKIRELEKFLTCKKCENIFPESDEWFVVQSCRDQLCMKCFDPQNWNGSCPACGAKADRKDVHANKSRIEFLQGLNTIKRIFGGETNSNLISKKGESTKEKTIGNNQSILKEKSITGEKSIIFDEDEDLDIDLNDDQVDVSSFDDVGNVKQPSEEKQAINDEDINDEKENEFIPPTLPPPPTKPRKRGAPSKKASETQNKVKKETKKVSQTQKAKNELKTYTAAELNKKNKKGETPLHAACNKRNENLVKHLLSQGASANTQDNNGLTPLHEVASFSNGFNIVKLLLEHGELLFFIRYFRLYCLPFQEI